MDKTAKAAEILRSALKRAKAVTDTSGDPVWGPWYVRADQRTIYETAIEEALKRLEGGGT